MTSDDEEEPRPALTHRPYALSDVTPAPMLEEVEEIANLRAAWDQEIVEELLERGVTPVLLSIDEVQQLEFRRVALCTLVDHRGQVVPKIRMQWSAMIFMYPDRIRAMR